MSECKECKVLRAQLHEANQRVIDLNAVVGLPKKNKILLAQQQEIRKLAGLVHALRLTLLERDRKIAESMVRDASRIILPH